MVQKLTFEQLRDVRDQLRRTLTGRSVLVPLGTKAFIPGFLTPQMDGEEERITFVSTTNTASNTTTITNHDSNTEEHNAKELKIERKEVTRSQALDLLQEEMDQLIHHSKKRVSSALSKPKTTQSTTTTTTTTQTTNVLPYFEIREEIDVNGNEIKAEAIDVSKHLEYLRQHPEVVEQTSLPSPIVITRQSEEESSIIQEEIPVIDLKPLSDGEYDTLASRLEELARLEEEADQQEENVSKAMKKNPLKTKNQTGWNKGFLNSKHKKSSIRTTTTTTPATKESTLEEKATIPPVEEVQEKTITSTQTVGNTIPSIPSTTKPISKSVFSGVIQERGSVVERLPEVSIPEISSQNRVRFGEQSNEIREIPRIGQTSVASIIRPPSRPIVGVGTIRQEPDKQPIPKKKLSRFAMERQQLNR